MPEFIKVPNLPYSKVLTVITAPEKRVIEALSGMGITCITTKESQDLSTPVNYHPDMLCHHLGGEDFAVYRDQTDLFEKLIGLGASVYKSKKTLQPDYPNDIALNALRLSRLAFGKTSSMEPILLEYYNSKKVELVDIKQGYTKCSVCVVDEKSIITSDKSISQKAREKGLDVLLISPGYIELNGYDYGFIGGTCGKIDKNVLAFAGDIKNHPQWEKIIKFCKERNVSVISLHNGPLQDIGSIIPIIEERFTYK